MFKMPRAFGSFVRSFLNVRRTTTTDDGWLVVLERERIIRTRDSIFDRSDRRTDGRCWAPRSTRRRRDSRVVEQESKRILALKMIISIETRGAHPGRGVDTR